MYIDMAGKQEFDLQSYQYNFSKLDMNGKDSKISSDMLSKKDMHHDTGSSLMDMKYIDDSYFEDSEKDVEFPGYTNCNCDDPIAMCNDNYCYRPDVDCPLEECPSGFICANNSCVCDPVNKSQCRPNCDTDTDCPNSEEMYSGLINL